MVRRRWAALCVAISIFLAGMAVPLLSTVQDQILLMIPEDAPTQQRNVDAIQTLSHQDRPLAAIQSALRLLGPGSRSRPNWNALRESDPGNGIYAWLELLQALRNVPASTRPVQPGPDLRIRLEAAMHAPPARLHETRQLDIARRALCGIRQCNPAEPDQRTSLEALQISALGGMPRPVLRELADRLTRQGREWREAQHPADALLAHAAVVRLFRDVVSDSPLPDVMLLAADKLPAALRELGSDADQLGRPIGGTARAQADRIAGFWTRWLASASKGDRVSMIPWSGDYALAASAHHRALGSLVAAVISSAIWIVLLLTAAASLVVSLIARAGDAERPSWQSRLGFWTSGGLVAAPLLILILLIGVANLPYTWLFSPRSVPAAVLVPIGTWIVLGLVTRWFVRVGDDRGALPSAAIWAMAAIILVATAVAVLLPLHRDPWRPPVFVQLFRRTTVFAGGAGFLVVLAWWVWGFIRRRRGGVRMGAQATATAGIASAALLFTTVLMMGCLWWNQASHIEHRRALALAAADPIADRLGPAWQETYLPGLREVVESAGIP